MGLLTLSIQVVYKPLFCEQVGPGVSCLVKFSSDWRTTIADKVAQQTGEFAAAHDTGALR